MPVFFAAGHPRRTVFAMTVIARKRGPWRLRLPIWPRIRAPACGLGLGLLLGLFGGAPTSSAEVAGAAAVRLVRLTHERVLSYPMEHVWPTALRLLRVDRGYTVVDRDAEAGYILFDFPVGGPVGAATGAASDGEARVGRGSLELLATTDASGRASVKLIVATDAGPSHLPHALGEALAAKLRAERGPPASPPPRTQPPPPKAPDPSELPTVPPAVDPDEL
jgi:hypothetical protein